MSPPCPTTIPSPPAIPAAAPSPVPRPPRPSSSLLAAGGAATAPAATGTAAAAGRRPLWRGVLDAVAAALGPRAMPALVYKALKQAKVLPRVLRALEEQMGILRSILSEGEHAIDWLEPGWRVLVQLESAFMG